MIRTTGPARPFMTTDFQCIVLAVSLPSPAFLNGLQKYADSADCSADTNFEFRVTARWG